MALIGDFVKPNDRQSSIGKVMGMMFLGGAAATFIGGIVSYFGSWQHVYLIYGIAELLLAFIMVVKLPRSEKTTDQLSIINTYKIALSNRKLVGIISIIFIMGYSVFGTFTFMGEYVNQNHDTSILFVGLILTSFGIGTVVGGRIAPTLRSKLRNKYITTMALLGAISLIVLSQFTSIVVIIIALSLFGLSFISLQSILVMTAQNAIPKQRGTAMSLASFNMFVGGAVATLVNRNLISINMSIMFLIAACLFIFIGIIGPKVVFINEKNKKIIIK
jgi:predicted MFS family arabinose efflux permease